MGCKVGNHLLLGGILGQRGGDELLDELLKIPGHATLPSVKPLVGLWSGCGLVGTGW